jgi:hypothetical protein
MAPFASGSARYDTMIVCPCSMGLMGRIAAGISNDLDDPRRRCNIKRATAFNPGAARYAIQPHPHQQHEVDHRSRWHYLSGNAFLLQQTRYL